MIDFNDNTNTTWVDILVDKVFRKIYKIKEELRYI